eukprot:6202778-Pleurochrysis_carterae.AAC.1
MIYCPRAAWRDTRYAGQQYQGVLALSAPFIVGRRDFKVLVAPIRRILDKLQRDVVLETSKSDDDVKNYKRLRDDESFDTLESGDESPLDLLNAQHESSSESSSYDPEPSPDNEALAHLGPTPLPLSACNELEQVDYRTFTDSEAGPAPAETPAPSPADVEALAPSAANVTAQAPLSAETRAPAPPAAEKPTSPAEKRAPTLHPLMLTPPAETRARTPPPTDAEKPTLLPRSQRHLPRSARLYASTHSRREANAAYREARAYASSH